MWGTAWAPSIRTSAPASWARRVMSSTGLIVPSVFDTWVNATSLGLSLSRTSNTSWRRIPSSVIGMNSRSASFSCASSCHGTRFAWCSISVRTITSPAPDVLAAPRVGDEVDRLGGVAREHDLVRVGDADEPGDLGARLLVLGRRLLADRVDPAMDVRVVLAVVGVHRLEHGARLLRRRRGVEVHQRVPVDLLVQDREVVAQPLGVDRVGRRARRRRARLGGGHRSDAYPAAAAWGSLGSSSASSGTPMSRPFSRRIGP